MTTKDRERRKQRLSDAKQLAEADDKPGETKAPLSAGQRVVAYCRVSSRKQAKQGNLRDQESVVQQAIEEYRAELLRRPFSHVGSGKRTIGNFSTLKTAFKYAKKKNAAVVAESLSRLIRPPEKNAQAGPRELKFLRRLANGVPWVLLLPEDATPAEDRSNQSWRGQEQKQRRGGRPKKKEPGWKKRRKEKCLPRFLELLAIGDLSRNRMARIIAREKGEDISIETLRKWSKQAGS